MRSVLSRTDRAWAEINMSNLIHNARALQKALPKGCDIMAVVKADAYGHGAAEVSRALEREGINAFAVATADEGIALRKAGINGEILVLGYTPPMRAAELWRYRLSQTVTDSEYADELSGCGKPLSVHVKVDTGMHRLGESCGHADSIERMFGLKYLKVSGIFTHLCVCDSEEADDIEFTDTQARRFRSLLSELERRGITLPKTHMQSSYGVLNRLGEGCGWARIGIALYGAAALRSGGKYVDLRPVLALKARVALVRDIAAGESAGYGRRFIAPRNTRLAVITIGYADGVPRGLSCGRGYALVRGRRAPIAGLICMDQLTIDATDIPGISRGDIVTIIGADGAEEITAAEAAQRAGTIPNELLCRLGDRPQRVYICDNAYRITEESLGRYASI
jgi:alanine racemase